LLRKRRAPAAGRGNSNGNGKSKNNDNSKNNSKGNSMAIVHVAFKSSSSAPPAAAHADYIMRDGQYAQRGSVELVESGNLPEFTKSNPRAFWLAADTHERANGRTYTELQIALPRELSSTQSAELARQAAREFMGDRFAYTMAIHTPVASDKIEQPHLHLMFSERAIDERTCSLPEEQFFKRNGAKKDREWNDREKPEEIRSKWCEMMNGAMERAGLDERVDGRSYVEQGRYDLEALKEPKLLGGEGREAVQLREQVEELREKRAEVPAPHLDQSAAIRELEKQAEAEVAQIEQRLEMELSVLDRLIEKARELTAEVKERATEFVREIAGRVESIFGKGNAESVASASELEQARPPTPSSEAVPLDQGLAEPDKKLSLEEAIDAMLKAFDQKMEADDRSQQEKQPGQEQEISPGHDKDFEIEM
jgi:hypothetical protein